MDGNIYMHRELIFSLNSTLCDNSSLKNGYFRINIQIGTSPSKDKRKYHIPTEIIKVVTI